MARIVNGWLANWIDPMMELKEQQKPVEKRGQGRREEGTPLVEDHAACDYRENVSDWEKAFFATSEIDQDRDEQLVNDNLQEGVSVEVSDFFQQKSVDDCHEIKNTNKIVKCIGQGNEEISLLGNLEEKGDGKKKREDDDTTQHQSFHVFEHSLLGVDRMNWCRVHNIYPLRANGNGR